MNKSRKILKDQRGVTVVLVVVMLLVLVGFLSLAIDIGYSMVVRNELQNISDGAALAACRELGQIYLGIDPADQSTYDATADLQRIIAKAIAVGQNNQAGGATSSGTAAISIAAQDVLIGTWDWDSDSLNQTLSQPDAVQVIARRDNNVNGPVATFFARVLGINTMEVRAVATAALSGPTIVEEGELQTPFGLSEHLFPDRCGNTLSFSPTTDSCVGWHNFFDSINAAAEAAKLLGFIEGDSACEHCEGLINGPTWLSNNFSTSEDPAVTPTTSAGDSFDFQGGDIASLFNGSYLTNYDGDTGTVTGSPANKPAPIIALFDYFRYRDGDGNNSIWTATVPVYSDPTDACTNPNGFREIVGFARIEVLSVIPPPNKSISVRLQCDFTVIEGRGGGGTFGNLKGHIPNLVQ